MSDMLFIEILFFVLGAIVGSFLNVCIWRIPRDESIVRPGSKCPGCGTPIRFYDNIPLVSYLVLRGKCRKCGQKISIRYAAVELLTAVLFAALSWLFGPSLELAVALVFTCLLIVVSFIDLEFFIIPDVLSLGGLVLGVLLSFFRRPDFWITDALLGVFLGGGILFAVAKLYEIVRKAEGMGGGDIKLLAMIGAFWGIKGVVFALVSGSIIGTLVGVPLMLVKREGGKLAIPFGPFLSLGALLFVMAGDGIIRGFFALVSGQ
jgi:leader peptidase (prepilin peptidase) / N-methyltransferase